MRPRDRSAGGAAVRSGAARHGGAFTRGCGGHTRAVQGAVRSAELRPVQIGCSGWNYDHWRNGVFYPPRCPPREWLDYYARHFDTVEVNATFYRLPRRDAVANWVRTSPAGFEFPAKMTRYIIHINRLRDLGSGLLTCSDSLESSVDSPRH